MNHSVIFQQTKIKEMFSDLTPLNGVQCQPNLMPIQTDLSRMVAISDTMSLKHQPSETELSMKAELRLNLEDTLNICKDCKSSNKSEQSTLTHLSNKKHHAPNLSK